MPAMPRPAQHCAPHRARSASAACGGIRRGLDARRGHVGNDALDEAGCVVGRDCAGTGRCIRAIVRDSLRASGGPEPAERAGNAGDYPLWRLAVDPAHGGAASVQCPLAFARRMTRRIAASMRIFGFAGWSGSGKTTLIEQLIPRLVQRGLAVSLVKHAHHCDGVRPAGQGFLPAPPRRVHRSAGHVERPLGADARAAGRARTAARSRLWRASRRAILC